MPCSLRICRRLATAFFTPCKAASRSAPRRTWTVRSVGLRRAGAIWATTRCWCTSGHPRREPRRLRLATHLEGTARTRHPRGQGPCAKAHAAAWRPGQGQAPLQGHDRQQTRSADLAQSAHSGSKAASHPLRVAHVHVPARRIGLSAFRGLGERHAAVRCPSESPAAGTLALAYCARKQKRSGVLPSPQRSALELGTYRTLIVFGISVLPRLHQTTLQGIRFRRARSHRPCAASCRVPRATRSDHWPEKCQET